MRKLYHYTSLVHLPMIEDDGFLKTVESNVSMLQPHAGPDVVWLTSRKTWCAQHWQLGTVVDKGQVRITVEVDDAVWWPEWSAAQDIDPDWYDILNKTGDGDADRWFVVERPIPRDEWTEVEVRPDSLDHLSEEI